jgi:FixJ family two-component response regulator
MIDQDHMSGARQFFDNDLGLSDKHELERTLMPTTARPIVFVVDDESVIAMTLAMILQNSGFDARPFTNPVKALDAARLEPPSLLISDVFMPEMLGTDLAIQMKVAHPTCKVLLFSGQAATSPLLDKARDLGHDFNLLNKPIHPADLLREIRHSME